MSVSTKLFHSERVCLAGSRCLALTTGLMMAAACAAQSTAIPTGISERVLREAASPIRWIKVHSELPPRVEAEARPAPAAAPAARRPAAPAVSKAEAGGRPANAQTATAPSLKPGPMETVAVAPMTATSQPGPAPGPVEPELVVIDRAEPEWDDEVVRKLGSGRVLARFHVSEDGYLSRIQIVDSASPRLTGPVMAALMQWRFEPISRPRVVTAEFGFGPDSQRQQR